MKNIKLYLFLLGLFLLLLLCNSFVPLFADDFANCMIDGHQLSSYGEVIEKSKEVYFSWTGRFFSSICIYLFLFWEKNIFNIFNALAFVLMGVYIYVIAILKGKFELSNIRLLPLTVIYSMLWFSGSYFGEIYFWITGSLVYFWPVLISLFLVRIVVRKIYDEKYQINYPLVLVLSFITGSLLENLSAIILATVCIMIFLDYKKNKIERWKFWMGIGLICGFILLIGAPGNYVRVEATPADVYYRLQNFGKVFDHLVRDQGLLWILAIRHFVNIKKKSLTCTTKTKVGRAFIFMAIGMNLIMLIPPYFPTRSCFPSAVFFIMGVVCLVCENDNHIPIFKNKIEHYILMVFVLFSLVNFTQALSNYNQLSIENMQREHYIEEEKRRGNVDLQVEAFTVTDDNHVFVMDLSDRPDWWVNRATATYYGIKSIVAKH